jgi:hypothetical protein
MEQVLIAIISAVVGAVGGYVGKARVAQAEVDRAKTENERLRDEHEEKHFQHRQGVYHELLNTHAELRARFDARGERYSESYFEQTLERLRVQVNGVAIFGKRDVAEAARALLSEHEQGSRPADLDRHRDDLADAMRRDVAPDR